MKSTVGGVADEAVAAEVGFGLAGQQAVPLTIGMAQAELTAITAEEISLNAGLQNASVCRRGGGDAETALALIDVQSAMSVGTSVSIRSNRSRVHSISEVDIQILNDIQLGIAINASCGVSGVILRAEARGETTREPVTKAIARGVSRSIMKT